MQYLLQTGTSGGLGLGPRLEVQRQIKAPSSQRPFLAAAVESTCRGVAISMFTPW